MPRSPVAKIVDKVDGEPLLLDQVFRAPTTVGNPVFLSDEAWEILAPLLPPERGRVCRPAQDNRRYFEAMVWIARTGAQWRQLPVGYGKWNSVFRRYRRWASAGVFDALFKSLDESVNRDNGKAYVGSRQAFQCVAHIVRDLAQSKRGRNHPKA